jgi:hypothetical protein
MRSICFGHQKKPMGRWWANRCRLAGDPHGQQEHLPPVFAYRRFIPAYPWRNATGDYLDALMIRRLAFREYRPQNNANRSSLQQPETVLANIEPLT